MENIYNTLVKLSVQRNLSDNDRTLVGDLFNKVCDAAKGPVRDDCLCIIKNRLWVM